MISGKRCKIRVMLSEFGTGGDEEINWVSLPAERALKLSGLVYPRDSWWMKIELTLENFIFCLRRSSFRTFLHPTGVVEANLLNNDLKRRFFGQALAWQVVVCTR